MAHTPVHFFIGNRCVYAKNDIDLIISEIQSQKMQLEDDNALLRRNNAELLEATR